MPETNICKKLFITMIYVANISGCWNWNFANIFQVFLYSQDLSCWLYAQQIKQVQENY